MQSRTTTLPLFTPLFVVLIVQAALLVTLAVNAFTLSPFEQGTLQHLPPFSFIYAAADAAWIAAGRSIAHLLTASTNIVIAVLCVWYGVNRTIKIVRYIVISVGMQFLASAAVNLSVAAVITYGSWWHVVAMVTTLLMAVSAVATAVTFGLVFKRLRALGLAHDAYVEKLIESGRGGADE